MKQMLANVMTGLLVICALVMTMLSVRQYLRADKASAATGVRGPAPAEKTTITSTEDLAAHGQSIGPREAPITLVEFSDFECPFCATLASTLATLQERHPNQIRIVYRHFPLPFHRAAMPAAIASECAGDDGRFAPFAALLFGEQRSLETVPLGDFARRAGVTSMPAFEACRKRLDVRERVLNDVAAATRLGLQATPTLILGQQMITGTATLPELEAWIREAGHPLSAK
ncbi:MAG: Periplasmic thiol:disulfide interchange protein DsbA [Gemmatimonadetes bacterium]|nr:Periplasmic thiol:disulfide interchange protein DsbA [Gemmatimonadota bacterium]